MTIIDNRKAASTTFEEIKVGEIFYDRFDSETFCLKTYPFRDASGEGFNAVCLADGQFYHFKDEEQVEAVRAVIQVYNKT